MARPWPFTARRVGPQLTGWAETWLTYHRRRGLRRFFGVGCNSRAAHAAADRSRVVGEEPAEEMTAAKRTIHLTNDNWADYFSDDYPASLVEGLQVGEGGIDLDDPIVTKLLERLAVKNERSTLVRYEMTRHDAAVLLEHLAGYPDCLFRHKEHSSR